ncbi:MAG: tRNA (adenosine(37)-N6)-threonylcarbamoyltransferase complex ATPase subunit type 1 TsaE [Pseudomonadota bacterium]
MIENQLRLRDESRTLALGRCLAKVISGGDIIFLSGPLGAGKTSLVRGCLTGLGYQGLVKSPTYTLVESYNIAENTIHHFDLYRLKSSDELEMIGIRDYFSSTAICMIEWPERATEVLPRPTAQFNFTIDGEQRLVELQTSSPVLWQVMNSMSC